MTTQEQYIERLKELVAIKFGREILSGEDCSALIEDIRQMVGIIVSEEQIATLFINKSRNATTPRPVTLSALARYIGYNSWSDFCSANDILPAKDTDIIPTTRRWGVIILTSIAIIVVITTIITLLTMESKSATPSQSESVIIEEFSDIEAEWLATTTEHCLTLREFYDDSNYESRVTKFIEEYTSTLKQEIAIDLTRYALEQNIDIDNNSIDEAAAVISDKCKKMCEGLRR